MKDIHQSNQIETQFQKKKKKGLDSSLTQSTQKATTI